MNIWFWFIVTILGLLGAPSIGSGVSLQLQANDGELKSLARFGQLIIRIAKSITSKSYAITLTLSFAWMLTIYACYVAFMPKSLLPPAGARANYKIILAYCMIDPPTRDAIAINLSQLGFSKSKMSFNIKDRRVSGTAMNDTVYFYHSTTEEFAKAIADKLSDKFGRHYATVRGDGEGINSEQFITTFSIHTIAKPCVAPT